MTRTWYMGLANEGTHTWIQLDGFDPEVNSMLKSELPGPARWHGKGKRWLFPLSWETCKGARKVANKFGADIKLTDSMYDWAVAERERQETIPDVNSMELTQLPKVAASHPRIWDATSSRPFQTVGAAFAARNRSCLIADQPGLGKTIQSIAAIVEAGITGPILVVAPKAAARLTWPQELAKWVPGDEVTIIGSHLKASEREYAIQRVIDNAGEEEYAWGHTINRQWIITSPNYLRIKAEVDQYNNYVYDEHKQKIINPVGEAVMQLFDVEWSAVIVDEAHQTLAGATGNKKKQSAQRLGLGALQIKHNGLRLALSGTPFRGKEVYIWGILNWLRPDMYRSYWKGFVEKYFDCWQDRYGMQIGRLVDAEAMYAEAKQVMIRRTKAEVAKDLPPKMYQDIWLDMEPRQKKAYDDLVRSATVQLDGGSLLANGVLAELTRMKQFAGAYGRMEDGQFKPSLPSNKFDWLVEWLDERGIDKTIPDLDSDTRANLPKIVIASQFSQLINIIGDGLKQLGIHGFKFTGATSDKDREAIKKDWQENDNSWNRVLLLTTTAGGVSLTLDAADDLVELDETWNPADQEQLEDRLHRLSRMHQVTIWRVRSKDTIEESIAKTNMFHDANIKDIIDGQRGVQVFRELVNR